VFGHHVTYKLPGLVDRKITVIKKGAISRLPGFLEVRAFDGLHRKVPMETVHRCGGPELGEGWG
jgi:hypothetical protein